MRTIASIAVFMFTLSMIYARETAEQQFKKSDIVAWCEVTQIILLEKPRIEKAMSSQMRKFNFRIVEAIKGEIPKVDTFSIKYAEYEVLNPKEFIGAEYIGEQLADEIHGRPRIEVGKLYKVYLKKVGDGAIPLNDRWSVLEMKVDPAVREKWSKPPKTINPTNVEQAAPRNR
jgi:hypothetical protein